VPRILVVGDAGYVGSVLVQELLDRGQAVRVVDRMYFGDHGLSAVGDRVEQVVADMRRLDPAVLDDVQTVINVGGLSNDPTAEFNPTANHEMNVTASVELAKLCKERSVSRYIYASSCSIYDQGVDDEERDVVLDEGADVDPRAAYSGSKYQAEQELLPMATERFSVVALRKATLYGFSPRMRYDLVVNTFGKDALSKGCITIHFGGEMWRPLAEVRDAARAYIALATAPAAKVNGQIFNLVYRNFRISELALRVREALREVGVDPEIRTEYAYKGIRNYRVSGRKLELALKFLPTVGVEESVKTMVEQIRGSGYTDFENPRYYNIRWMRMLEEAHRVIDVTGSVFEAPARRPRVAG